MKRWRPNTGNMPLRSVGEIKAMGYADNPEDAPPITHVFVRLRNGKIPPEKWPVDTGREPTTRWTLLGHPFDIMDWIEA